MPQPALRDPLFLAYFDLWCRYRALIALLATHTGQPAERIETDAREIRHGLYRLERLDEALEAMWSQQLS